MVIEVSGINMVAASILVFFVGYFLVNNIKLLQKYNIPEGIIGGMVFSLIFYLLKKFFSIQVTFDIHLRDLFLLIFFCTIGMTAKVNLLISGGKTLLKLVSVIIIFLFLQNLTGIIIAKLIGTSAINGLIAGSITLAGGHGTAISWGSFFEEHGYKGAIEFGLISATIGLICGGIVGGPVAQKLIARYNLIRGQYNKENSDHLDNEVNKNRSSPPIERLATTFMIVLTAIFFVIICIIIGGIINKYLQQNGIITPAYLSVLIIGIIFINTSGFFKINISPNLINLFRDVSLQVFITMSMMCIDIEYLFNSQIFPILLIIAVQVIMVIFFAKYIFFKVAGRDYDAAVITAGFIGSGLGATPVALANVDSIGRKYHQSEKALLIVPLLGSVFTDFFSAIILQFFLYYIGV